MSAPLTPDLAARLGGELGGGTPWTLTGSQRSLWSSQRRHPGAPLQNMALLTHIDGPVDADRLAAAFSTVVQSTRTLRLTIDAADRAMVVREVPASTTVIDLARSATDAWARQRVLEPIDVSTAVYDSVVLRHDDATVSWYLCLHHVATDATSSALVFDATARAYHGETVSLTDLDDSAPPLTKRRQRAIDFWHDRPSAPVVESLYRPIDARSTRSERQRVDGVPMEAIEAALDGRYRMISRDLAWTTLLTTAVSVHVHRVSGADRFAIGLPVHNRSGRDRQLVVGPLMEVYPVDVVVDSTMTFAELHAAVSKQVLTVVGNALPDVGASASDVSGIVNVIPRGSLGSFGPFATSTTWIHPGAADPFHLLGVQLTTYGSSAPSLELDVNHAGAPERPTAVDHFRSILVAMIDDPDATIVAHPLLTAAELAETRAWGRGPALPSDRFVFDPRSPRTTGSVIDRLSVALANGTRPALIDGSRTLTGQELWKQAGAVAASLVAVGVGPGHRVGVEMARSADAVVAILGVLRAGASYVPIDPSQPERRRTSISERAGVSGVLTDLDGIDPGAVLETGSAPVDAEREAYVLFTSGSTGEPKGVSITHGGLADYLAFGSQNYLGPKQRRPVAPLFTSLGFDLTVTSLFLPLIAGGTLVVVPDDGIAGLRAVAGRSDLTWIKATPSHLELLSRMLPARHRISTVVVGGEAFPVRLANELADGHPGLSIFNEYGPTEAVVGCMIHEFEPTGDGTGDVPIGRPAPGVVLRIVDESGHDVPPGVAGELLISSPGLSPGYLDRPADTHPFSTDGTRRWYASGDVVRLVGSAGATYLGRTDDQIKLNGVRLEPAEVVAAIEAHPDVARAVVRLWQPIGEARPLLAAWVESVVDAEPLELRELRAFLLGRLTSHQIPAAISIVDALPFNDNGKLDIDALPVPERVRGAAEEIHAGGDLDGLGDERLVDEARLAWAKALGLPTSSGVAIGPGDDFFVLGGDSLAALEMTATLGDSIGVEIGEGLVFAAPTFADFVAAIAALDPDRRPPAGPVPLGGVPLLSPGEQAMLFEHRLAPESARYNIGRRYVVDIDVDGERLRRAAEAVVARHAPLHTTYAAERRVLRPDEALDFSISSLEPDSTISDEVSRDDAGALYRVPFDLDNGPLLRVALHRLDPEAERPARSAIVVVTHHISGDAGSLDRLWEDLDAAYSGRDLPPIAVSYADHAAWQRDRDRGADFWADLWSTPVETGLGLPGAAGDHEGGYAEQPASFTASQLRGGPGRTPTATALAALSLLLDRHHRPSRDERPARYAIGLTASVREHPSSEPMVGYFLNTLPLVVEVSSQQPTVTELATVTSDLLARTLPLRSHPFADMVARARREHRPLPVPQVLLAVEDLAPSALDGQRAEHEVLASGEAIATVTVFVQIRGEQVDLGIEFEGSVLDRSRAHLLLDDLDALIAGSLGIDRHPGPVLRSEQHEILRGDEAPDPTPLTSSILDHIGQRGDAIAARSGPAALTWTALGRRSALLAEQLRVNGVGPGDRVAVSLPRSVDLIVAVVALLRTGAVYVPLDPSYPTERREQILRAAVPTLVIVEPGAEPAWLPSATVPADRAGEPTIVDHTAQSTDPAYVIFTSGSTGTPKGVEVTHGRLATSTRARDGVYGDRPERFLLLSSIGFDSSIVGLFWTLFAGGEIVIPTDVEAHDPDALLGLIDRCAVSHVLMVPSLYRALLTRGATADHWPAVVTVAGEACSSELVERHHELRPSSELWNEYGPTEGTVWATAHRCVDGDAPVPIGRPIPGSWCAVVDVDGVPVPLGASGELMIGGAGVVEGYLPSPDGGGPVATAFVDTEWGRAYRTGDAVTISRDADGESTLVFLGRVDDQLNVGGVRLEPGEVERVLTAVVGVDDAAVVAGTIGTSDRQVLIAHVEGSQVDLTTVRNAAASALPSPARPARYVVHERLPKTPHGKVDRAALATMEIAEETISPDDTIDPSVTTPTEQVVLDLFIRHIRSEVGLDDGFFEAGGDSLSALTLAIDVEDHFGTPFSVTTLLAQPTARAVARHLADSESVSVGGDAAAATVPSPTLVEWIRPRVDDRVVLVLLAPGSGHLLGYEPLIGALDPSTPLLGVRLPGYDGKAEPVASVTELTSIVGPLLDDALRTAGVDGQRIVLLGGSSGGLLAWELQHRAESTGRGFAALILQDTVHPDWRREQAAIGLVADLRTRLSRDGAVALATELYGRGERRFRRWQRSRQSRAAAEITGSEMPAVIAQRMFAATTAGLMAYAVPEISANVLFVAAANTDPDATFDRWKASTRNMRVEIFEGDHFGDNGITAARNVGPVAATIDAMLRDLDG